jgi:hypothetical protein
VGKLAKFLRERGHEVKVITSISSEPDQSLPLEISDQDVIRCGERQLDAPFDAVVGLLKRRVIASQEKKNPELPGQVTRSSPQPHSFGGLLRRHYYALLHIPDKRGGWFAQALRSGRCLLEGWRADVVLASSPPMTALLVARRLGREFSIPWVADLRDLWTDNPYYSHPAWRKRLDEVLERRVFRTAAMLVTVTPPWAETIRRKFGKPTHIVLNGYVEQDFPTGVAPVRDAGAELTIVYTGNIYRGYRDPSPLFAALRLVGDRRKRVRIRFYGPSEADIKDLALEHGVAEQVTVEKRVAYRESLAVQMRADVLLLLQWNNPADEGNIPAKFFEYIGAGRPILFIGYEGGALAQVIRQRNAGFVGNDPEAIAQQLGRWIDQHEHNGVPALTVAAKQGLGRDEQFCEMERLLKGMV